MRTQSSGLERLFVVTGTVIVGLPIAAPFAAVLISFGNRGPARFDLLMPGELVVAAITGGVVLVAHALVWHRPDRLWTILGLTGIVLSFAGVAAVADQALSASTGGSDTGALLLVASLLYASYVVSVLSLLVGGIVTCRRVFRGSFSASVRGGESRYSNEDVRP